MQFVRKLLVYLRIGNFSDLNSAFYKVLVPVTIFQFPDMRNENRLFYQIFQPS